MLHLIGHLLINIKNVLLLLVQVAINSTDADKQLYTGLFVHINVRLLNFGKSGCPGD